LVTLGIREAAPLKRAATSDHSIGQRGIARLAELLVNIVLIGVSLLVQVIEDVLGNLCLFGGRRAAKFVEVAIEPFVYFSVQGMIVITNLLACFALLTGLGLRGRAILICSADIDRVVASEPAVSGIYIS
jgi:hypothetical protein